jgi:hypothetical protein
MGNPKIAMPTYCLAAGFIQVIALYSSPRAVITASMPVVTPISDLNKMARRRLVELGLKAKK